MPSTAARLPIDWLHSDDATCDPWVLSGDNPDDVGWRDACIGNGLIGQRLTSDGDSSGYRHNSGSFRHGLWGSARENPQRPQGLIELPNWATLSIEDGDRDLRRRAAHRPGYQQKLDMRTATLTTNHTLAGPLQPVIINRRTWMCQHVPQLGILEASITAPEGGMIEVGETIDCLNWPDLATPSTVIDHGDLVQQATSDRFGHQVWIRSRLTIDGEAYDGDVCLREAWGRRTTRVRLTPGQTIQVTKVVAITCDLDGDNPNTLGDELLNRYAGDLVSLRAGHEAAWHDAWQSRIEVPHAKLQQLLNASWYHHLIAMSPGVHSHGPTGLCGNGWDSLVFWDTDTWTLPVYAMLAPELAKACVAYRHATIDGARKNAEDENERGTRWPWMSGEDGRECCSLRVFQNERHIVSCVARAQWTYAKCAGDDVWLSGPGREVITGCAEYWASKVTANADGSYSINGVCGSDEHAGEVDDNATTNWGAAWTLRLAAQLAREAGEEPPQEWSTIADGLRILWIEERGIPKQMASWQHGQEIKQADTALMVYPWAYPFDDTTKLTLVDYYREHYVDNPIMMGRAIDAVIDCELGRTDSAWNELGALCEHYTLPFLVCSEDPVNERLPFLTGYGGVLQLALAGFAGIRVEEEGLTISPHLPEGLPWMRIHGLHDGGHRRTVTVHQDGRVEDG